MEVGKSYYLIAHAYWHYVGIVDKIVGPGTVILRNVCQVHSCGRNWTKFFADGFGNDTKYDVLPDGVGFKPIIFIAWNHKIPTERRG